MTQMPSVSRAIQPHPHHELLPVPDRLSVPLPNPLSSFIGRDQEIETISELLLREEVRLVTLTGPGGVGKTRLSLRIAWTAGNRFRVGVAFIPLAPVSDPDRVVPVIAQALGILEVGGQPLDTRLAAALFDRHLLLVLDNCEHLIPAAPQIANLLAACPHVTVLATSRERLHLTGEHVVSVRPLGLTDRGTAQQSSDESDAVRLFVARAGAARADFVLTAGNTAAVREIVRMLDGLPLAIELAAARISHLPPAALLTRLEQRLPLLTGGAQDGPARHQTVRDTIAWSHDLLAAEEQTVFRRLAAFVGGATLDAAETVVAAAGDLPLDVLSAIASLVDKSLVQQEAGLDNEPRFVMLETVREFGLEQLAACGEDTFMRDAHAAWYLAFAQQRGAALQPVTRTEDIDRLEAEHSNILGALRWLERTDRGEDMLCLANNLWWFWYVTGTFREGLAWTDLALEMTPDAPASKRAEAANNVGHFHHTLGNFAEAQEVLDRARKLAQEAGSLAQEARSMLLPGILAEDQGDFAIARELLLSAHELFAAGTGDPWDQKGLVVVIYHLGVVAFGQGDISRAEEYLCEAISAGRTLGDPLVPIWSLEYLALAAIGNGDFSRVAQLLGELLVARAAFPRLFDHMYLPVVATLAGGRCLAEQAAHLFGATARRADGADLARSPEADVFRNAEIVAKRTLGDAGYQEAWDCGWRMQRHEIDAAIERVLSGIDAEPQSTVADQSAGLTSREMDVLRLLVEGQSDRQIAEALFIGPRTVQTHVSNILAKLEVSNRAEAAAAAVRQGLI